MLDLLPGKIWRWWELTMGRSNVLEIQIKDVGNHGVMVTGWEGTVSANGGTWENSQVVLVVKNPPANAGDIRDAGLILGWERSPEGRTGSPVQYSCLENSMDRGAWQATILGVSKSWKCLK